MCAQKYLRSDKLLVQLRETLASVSLPTTWVEHISTQFDVAEKEEGASGALARAESKSQTQELDRKIDSLVSLYLDGDIPKESYLSKKNSLLLQKASLTNKKAPEGKSWVEPARMWLKDIQEATQLQTSDDLYQIKTYFKKTGTNSILCNASIAVSFCPPTERARSCLSLLGLPPRAPLRAPAARALSLREVSLCGPVGI